MGKVISSSFISHGCGDRVKDNNIPKVTGTVKYADKIYLQIKQTLSSSFTFVPNVILDIISSYQDDNELCEKCDRYAEIILNNLTRLTKSAKIGDIVGSSRYYISYCEVKNLVIIDYHYDAWSTSESKIPTEIFIYRLLHNHLILDSYHNLQKDRRTDDEKEEDDHNHKTKSITHHWDPSSSLSCLNQELLRRRLVECLITGVPP